MTIQELKASIERIYDEAMKTREELEGVEHVDVDVVKDVFISVHFYDESGCVGSQCFTLKNAQPFDFDNDEYIDVSSVDAFFNKCTTIAFTQEEAEVLENYIFRKLCKLKDAGLEDSRCYRVLSNVRMKLKQ